MMNDEFKNEMPTSQEFYAAQAPADWANEEDMKRESLALDTALENAFKCDDDDDENSDAPTYDEVANTFAADAWHDAHEYPEW